MPHPNKLPKPLNNGIHLKSSRKQQGGAHTLTKENKKQFIQGFKQKPSFF